MQSLALVIADSSGVIHMWSPGAVQHFGYSPAEAVGQTLDLIIPPDFRSEHWSGFRAAMTSGVAKYDGQVMDLPVLCKSGDVVVFRGQLTFLRDADRCVVGAIGIFESRVPQ
jgi:PAS domain S-box-containing protein